jgi:hypothetical protein
VIHQSVYGRISENTMIWLSVGDDDGVAKWLEKNLF